MKADLTQDVKGEEVLKISEFFLHKIKKIKEKEEANTKLAPEVTSREYEVGKIKEYYESKVKEYEESKSTLHKSYEELEDANSKLMKELKDAYGDIQIQDIETGEYTKIG